MQTVTILRMSHNPTELRNADDRPYDDIKDMKRQLDKLTGYVGEMKEDMTEVKTALKGNEYGTEGLVLRVETLEASYREVVAEQKKFAVRMEEYENRARNNRRYIIAFVAAVSGFAGTVFKIFIDHIVPVKK